MCSSRSTNGRWWSRVIRPSARPHSSRFAAVANGNLSPLRFSHMRPPTVFLIAASPSTLSSSVQAQQAPYTTTLRPVVVTATRVPVDRRSAPSTVTVIQGEELRARGVTSVADALSAVPGLSVIRSGSFGATTSLFARGGESDYVKVLIDGVPANSPGGVFDFSALTTDNVERIEVVRGPASVVYGSDAVTGV